MRKRDGKLRLVPLLNVEPLGGRSVVCRLLHRFQMTGSPYYGVNGEHLRLDDVRQSAAQKLIQSRKD